MAVVLRIGADDWRLVRFAVSPLQETTGALRLVRRVLDGHVTPTRPWEVAAVRRAAQLPLGPLLALLPAGSWNPDVLNPPPSGPHADFADELTQVAAVDPDTFAGELARCLTAQGAPSRRPHRPGSASRSSGCSSWLGVNCCCRSGPACRTCWPPTLRFGAQRSPPAALPQCWPTCTRRCGWSAPAS